MVSVYECPRPFGGRLAWILAGAFAVVTVVCVACAVSFGQAGFLGVPIIVVPAFLMLWLPTRSRATDLGRIEVDNTRVRAFDLQGNLTFEGDLKCLLGRSRVTELVWLWPSYTYQFSTGELVVPGYIKHRGRLMELLNPHLPS